MSPKVSAPSSVTSAIVFVSMKILESLPQFGHSMFSRQLVLLMTGDGVVFNSSVSGSPVTGSGTLAPTLATHSANTVLAGPSSGGAAAPTFRALVGSDLPNPSSSTLGGVESYAAVSHQFLTSISTSGVPASAQPSFSDISGSIAVGQVPNNLKYGSLGIVIDGGGSAISTGTKGYLYCPYAGTITAATLIADQSGSCVIDVWKAAYPTVPNSGNSITASAKPTLSSAQVSQDSTLTGWTTLVSAGDVLGFHVDSATTLTRVSLTLSVTKS